MTNSTDPSSKQVKSSNFSDDFLQQVRDTFLATKLTNANANQNYDQADIDRLASGDHDDWFVRRFLVEKSSTSVEAAVKKLHDALVWRKQFGMSLLHDAMFPAEFYNLGSLFSYLPDRDGNIVFIMRLRFNLRHPKLPYNQQSLEMAQKFLMHQLEKVVAENPNRKLAMIVDFQNSSMINADMRMAKFVLFTLKNYYYDAFAWGCFLEMPWIFNKLWAVIRVFLNEESRSRVRFCTRDNITEHISKENLPDFMGGDAKHSYRVIPTGTELPNMFDWALESGVVESIKQAEFMKMLFDTMSTV